jgi:hypothetical protein
MTRYRIQRWHNVGCTLISVYCDIMPISVYTRYRVYPISGIPDIGYTRYRVYADIGILWYYADIGYTLYRVYTDIGCTLISGIIETNADIGVRQESRWYLVWYINTRFRTSRYILSSVCTSKYIDVYAFEGKYIPVYTWTYDLGPTCTIVQLGISKYILRYTVFHDVPILIPKLSTNLKCFLNWIKI